MSIKQRFLSLFLRRKPRHLISERPRLPENIQKFLRDIPKAEIHFHFEGAIGCETIYELGCKYKVDDIRTRSDAEWCLYFHTANMFFERFLYVSSLLREPEDFYQASSDLGRRLNEENIRYIEITVAPLKFIRSGIPYLDLIEAVDRGLLETSGERGREHRFIIDVVRDLGPKAGLEMLETVKAYPHPRVVAVGLGGSEQYTPAESKEVFEFAETIGLKKTAHAGEGRGPQSIWGALQTLGVKRIDHGVRAREDETLVRYLAEHRIALNLCPTSNVMLGVVPSLEEHPIRYYHDQGIPVNVSTDDPSFFKTSLGDELGKMIVYQRFQPLEIPRLIENALHASFLEEEAQERFLREFREETQQCVKKYDLA